MFVCTLFTYMYLECTYLSNINYMGLGLGVGWGLLSSYYPVIAITIIRI